MDQEPGQGKGAVSTSALPDNLRLFSAPATAFKFLAQFSSRLELFVFCDVPKMDSVGPGIEPATEPGESALQRKRASTDVTSSGHTDQGLPQKRRRFEWKLSKLIDMPMDVFFEVC